MNNGTPSAVFIVMSELYYGECSKVESVHLSKESADAEAKRLESNAEQTDFTAWVVERPLVA